MTGSEAKTYANKELVLFKRFLAASVFMHIVFLVFDPSHFFFVAKNSTDEGTINIDLIAFEAAPPKQELDPLPPAPLLPQVPKKFELEVPKKPEEMVLEEKEPIKEEPKVQIDQKKIDEENLTKVSLDRLMKELNRQKEKEEKHSQKHSLLSNSLKERKKELENGLIHGTLTLGDSESSYRSVVTAWIRRNYVLPEIYELKNADIRTIVELTLNREGGIAKLTLKSSSQNSLFDQLVMKAIEKSTPFPTPPREEVGKVITIKFDPKSGQ